jgi:nucleoside-diphosphate-sugar epimerase
VLNIGSGLPTQVRELASLLVEAAGFGGHLDEAGDGSGRSAAVPWQAADVSAARAALGWRPRRTLAESVADLWQSAGAGAMGSGPVQAVSGPA